MFVTYVLSSILIYFSRCNNDVTGNVFFFELNRIVFLMMSVCCSAEDNVHVCNDTRVVFDDEYWIWSYIMHAVVVVKKKIN